MDVSSANTIRAPSSFSNSSPVGDFADDLGAAATNGVAPGGEARGPLVLHGGGFGGLAGRHQQMPPCVTRQLDLGVQADPKVQIDGSQRLGITAGIPAAFNAVIHGG